MKKVMILIAVLCISFTFESYSELAVPTIIMGTIHEIIRTDGVRFVTCPEPTDIECQTCDGNGDGPVKNNVGRFYHDPINQNTGTGYTNINVERRETPSGREYYYTINAGNQIITDYQLWLNYFNLVNLLLP